jgi:hypothetical protein
MQNVREAASDYRGLGIAFPAEGNLKKVLLYTIMNSSWGVGTDEPMSSDVRLGRCCFLSAFKAPAGRTIVWAFRSSLKFHSCRRPVLLRLFLPLSYLTRDLLHRLPSGARMNYIARQFNLHSAKYWFLILPSLCFLLWTVSLAGWNAQGSHRRIYQGAGKRDGTVLFGFCE